MCSQAREVSVEGFAFRVKPKQLRNQKRQRPQRPSHRKEALHCGTEAYSYIHSYIQAVGAFPKIGDPNIVP